VLDVPAERPSALDDADLAWLAAEAKAKAAEAAPPPAPPPKVTEQTVAQYERRAGAERRRRGVGLALGVVAALLAAGATLVFVSGRSGVGPFAKRAREAREASPATILDASGLAARPKVEEPAAPPAPAAAPAPLRRKTARISRTDRRLLDLLTKKEDAAVVAPEGDAMDAGAAGLEADAVARTVGANRKAFDACVSRALRLNPNLKVARRATLVVTVQPAGSVTGAFIAEEEVDRSDLGACLCAAARRMVFPSFEGEALDVSMPLSLSTGF
jgi:hypothetical protein